MNKPPFKNVLCTGLILDEKGVKMSKKFGNFKDPVEAMNKYGSDTLGMYLMRSPTVDAEPLLYTEKNIEQLLREMIPWQNAVKFFVTHSINYLKKGNTFDTTFNKSMTSKNVLNQWILSRLGTVLTTVTGHMDKFQVNSAIQTLLSFIDDLTNWYLKLNRERLKGIYGSEDWNASLTTLFKVLFDYTLMMAPFTPFLCEHMYQFLKQFLPQNLVKESVLMEQYPTPQSYSPYIDSAIELKFSNLMRVVKLIRNIRDGSEEFTSIKVPLKSVTISHNNPSFLQSISELVELVKDEVNSLEFIYQPLSGAVTYKILANNRTIGTKYKKEGNKVKALVEATDQKLLQDLYEGNGKLSVLLNDQNIILENTDYKIEAQPKVSEKADKMVSKVDGELMVTVCLDYSYEVHLDYQMRNLVVAVQTLRKSTDLQPWDKIQICLVSSDSTFTENLQTSKKFLEERFKTSVAINRFPDSHFATSTFTTDPYKNQKDAASTVTIYIEKL
jgi:isoleucyl-tRNA synthetase